ncbi:MAG TPA: hypothetical protein VN713_09640 [Sphingomicrobium sp.]|nr:hypothetical protein [Sphingomicrobium sp.]
MATAAAAAVARARRDVQHHFFSLDAVRPDRAVDFDPPTRLQRRQFERMRDRGIIHDTGEGRYWLDVVAYDVDLRARHRRVKTALIILLIILAAMLLATSFGLLQ